MCGIFGIAGTKPTHELIYPAMLQLQHRGQDAAGVFSYDPHRNLHLLRKSLGLVSRLFDSEIPVLPSAHWAISHVRYTTSGKSPLTDAQPLFLRKGDHSLAIVHNGNLVNYPALREELENQGIYFQTTCDTEVILNLLNLPSEGNPFDSLCNTIKKIYEKIEGSYSVIGIWEKEGLFAFRDPQGIRPLLLGKGENFIAIASETYPLSKIGCHKIEDIQPGHAIFIDKAMQLHQREIVRKKHAHCSFEFNYFAKPHAIMEGKEVYSVRYELGRLLAEKIHRAQIGEVDVVVAVPETGYPAGIALAQHLGIPFAEGFVRQSQMQRTFIMPGQNNRTRALLQKLGPIRSVFEGKSVIIVDDSIVRGTVSKRTIQLAREAKAKKIIFASTFPPLKRPCIYGIDFHSPLRDEL